MAKIDNAQLTVTTDPTQDRASVTASCDVELTEFEVNAVKLLKLTYTLDCQVLNRDLQYEAAVLVCDPQTVPAELPVAHMLFGAVAPMSDLHQHVFTRDQLIAEFTLTNGETGARHSLRSNLVTADLAG